MITKSYKKKKHECGICGHYAYKQLGICLTCHIQRLRESVLMIEEGKAIIREALSPENQIKFDAMDSQRKKLLYFQFFEAGMIKFTFAHNNTNQTKWT